MDGFILRVPKIPCIKTKKAGGWHKKREKEKGPCDGMKQVLESNPMAGAGAGARLEVGWPLSLFLLLTLTIDFPR
jgi:hypothetical protein